MPKTYTGESLVNKWYWQDWKHTLKIILDNQFSTHTGNQVMMDLNIKFKMTKLLEENIVNAPQ